MIGYIIISVFILILVLFVYREYKNEKKYEEERRQRRQDTRKKAKKPIEKPSIKEAPKKVPIEKKPSPAPVQKKTIEKETVKKETAEVIEEPKDIAISLSDYPKFDHSRLIEMGLSQEEAKEFVRELIPQIGSQIPLIKEAMAIPDFHEMERLTHSIKGSSTTVGTGGVSDLLADFNTYLKSGAEPAIAEAYVEQLKYYCEELKEQYS